MWAQPGLEHTSWLQVLSKTCFWKQWCVGNVSCEESWHAAELLTDVLEDIPLLSHDNFPDNFPALEL